MGRFTAENPNRDNFWDSVHKSRSEIAMLHWIMILKNGLELFSLRISIFLSCFRKCCEQIRMIHSLVMR